MRGSSLYKVTGGCSGEEHTEIQALLTQDEFASVMQFIRNNNIYAFITASNCSEVYGLWAKHKKNRTSGRVELSPEDQENIAARKNNKTLENNETNSFYSRSRNGQPLRRTETD